MDYKNLNDYELIYQVRENDEVAYGVLIDKYSNLVKILANKYLSTNKNIGLEFDDLYQEGMVGVLQALRNYKSEDTLFYTYASLCARREMDKIIKFHKRKKHMALNNYVSLNKKIYSDSKISLEEVIPSNYDIEKEYESKDRLNKILEAKYDLDLLDSSILELRVNGFSPREIAILLELSYKAVDYHIRKIRKKIVKFSY